MYVKCLPYHKCVRHPSHQALTEHLLASNPDTGTEDTAVNKTSQAPAFPGLHSTWWVLNKHVIDGTSPQGGLPASTLPLFNQPVIPL